MSNAESNSGRVINFRQASFLLSSPSVAKCPLDAGAEVAFVGRSNAGKSTALNTIAEQKSLARTSKTPGRTQLINFFQLTDEYRLVDLPGYGFAKAPIAVKQEWEKFITEYLRQRESLAGIVVAMDIRHPMKDYDQQMLQWAADAELPVHVLLTKADKVSRGAGMAVLHKIRMEIPFGHTAQLFSGLKKTGMEEARSKLSEWLTNHGWDVLEHANGHDDQD